ncbi:DUF2059 domain-containing protein [Caulobacter sp. S45]|uniref:DUF2059 domain-containing protein n=1 Tax=Caulobacter sp. S45 TaxID=1641861 RepID=UPI001C203850|nr:DUF2059 domain-containing protein [Caulobacter sp. S45]
MRPSAPALLAAAVLGAFLTSPALAQGVVSTARPAPPEAASLTAPIVDGPVVRIDPKRQALARQIYDLIGAQTMGTSVRSMTTAMSLQFANMMDDRSEARAKAIVAAVGDGMNSVMPQVIDTSVSAMAHTFTEAQLQDMLAFYQSPTGRVVLLKMPAVTQQSNAAIVTYLPQVLAGIEDSYCSRVKCSSRERKGLEAVAAHLAAAHPAG